MAALTLYQSNDAATTLTSAKRYYSTTNTTSHTSHTTGINSTTALGYDTVRAGGNSGNVWAGSGSAPAPSGVGLLLDDTSLEGQTIAAGVWTTLLRGNLSAGTATGDLYAYYYKYNGGSYTAIGSAVLAAQSLSSTAANWTLSSGSLPAVAFGVGDKLYVEFDINFTALSGTGTATFSWSGFGTTAGGGDGNYSTTTPNVAATPSGVTLPAASLNGTSTLSGTPSVVPAGITLPARTLAGTSTLGGNAPTISGSGVALPPGLLAGSSQMLGAPTVYTPTKKGLLITLAGQNITRWVQEKSIDIEMQLAQGAGTAKTGNGRAATASMLVAFGPAATALGSGQPINQTTLANAIGADNPASYWRCNDTDGSSVTDATGNTSTGSLSGNVLQNQGSLVVGDSTSNSFRFDGSYGTQAVLGTTHLPTGNNPWAARATFNMDAYPSNSYGTILKWGSLGTNQSVILAVSAAGYGQVRLYNSTVLQTTKPLSPGLVYSLGATWDGALLTLTLNGVAQATASHAALSLQASPASLGNIPGVSQGFVGRISEAAIFNATVSTGRMQQYARIVLQGAMPVLVRQGEILVSDANGNRVFGGYASKLSDATDKTTNYTKIDCYDYWQDLDRVIVNAKYVGVSDTYIILDLLNTYAPWLNVSSVNPAQNYLFTNAKVFRNVSLRQAIQTVCDVTGFQAYVDAYKNFYYTSPAAATTAPFGLSDSPDFSRTYPHVVTKFEQDDNAVINRATFYGGNRTTSDYTQDLSTQANGSNTTFLLAYQPRNASDGKIHVLLNGVEQAVGHVSGGSGKSDTLKSAGGTADVLVDTSNQTLTFNVAPATGAVVTSKYRYQVPLTVQVSNSASYAYFGRWFDGVIDDTSVLDQQTAQKRLAVLLAEQSYGLLAISVTCYQPGVYPGQLLAITNAVRGMSASYQVQKVTIRPLGAGNFAYDIECGAWGWNIIDAVIHAGQRGALVDNNTDEATDVIQVATAATNLNLAISVTTRTTATGQYYLRDTATGDGHDAYIGRSTLA